MICQKLAEVKSDILKFYFVFDTNRVKRKGLAMKNISHQRTNGQV